MKKIQALAARRRDDSGMSPYRPWSMCGARLVQNLMRRIHNSHTPLRHRQYIRISPILRSHFRTNPFWEILQDVKELF